MRAAPGLRKSAASSATARPRPLSCSDGFARRSSGHPRHIHQMNWTNFVDSFGSDVLILINCLPFIMLSAVVTLLLTEASCLFTHIKFPFFPPAANRSPWLDSLLLQRKRHSSKFESGLGSETESKSACRSDPDSGSVPNSNLDSNPESDSKRDSNTDSDPGMTLDLDSNPDPQSDSDTSLDQDNPEPIL